MRFTALELPEEDCFSYEAPPLLAHFEYGYSELCESALLALLKCLKTKIGTHKVHLVDGDSQHKLAEIVQ